MIAFASGTRADWGLLLPLARELRFRGKEIGVVATNMHLLEEFGHTVDEIVADGFEPVARIPVSGSPEKICGEAAIGFGKFFRDVRPEAVVILGDRFEMLGVASAALMTGVPIIHIAGGTVSEGAFDDSIRHAITKMASLHLVETPGCRARVIQMGENPEDVVHAGATGVWNILSEEPVSARELEDSLGGFFCFSPKTMLATLHYATLDDGSPALQTDMLITALERLMAEDEEINVLFTYPNNDVDPRPAIDRIESFAARWPEKVCAVASLGRRRYASALRYVCAVVGNSSSGIVEAPSAGIPTLDIGIRQQGRERAASVIHCDMDDASIEEGLRKVLSDEVRRMARTVVNPYHFGETPAIMADAIMKRNFQPFPLKKFHQF